MHFHRSARANSDWDVLIVRTNNGFSGDGEDVHGVHAGATIDAQIYSEQAFEANDKFLLQLYVTNVLCLGINFAIFMKICNCTGRRFSQQKQSGVNLLVCAQAELRTRENLRPM